jgi:predicted nucleic acid-binding Zn ribbon protein
MNLTYFLVKMYMLVAGRKLPVDVDTAYAPPATAATAATTVDIDGAPFERRCVNCAKSFVPIDPDQIFCESDCKDFYMTNLKTRTPFAKNQTSN